jgi:hypothetical protein
MRSANHLFSSQEQEKRPTGIMFSPPKNTFIFSVFSFANGGGS